MLRNSLIPVVTFLGADLGTLMGGAIVTERIFNIPGVGYNLFKAIQIEDGPALVGFVTLLVIVYAVMALVVDRGFAVLRPAAGGVTDATKLWPRSRRSPPGLRHTRRRPGQQAPQPPRARPRPLVASAIIVVLLAMSAFPSLFASADPQYCDLSRSLQGPSAEAWFGYDPAAATSTPAPSTGRVPPSSSACSPRPDPR